MNAGTHRLFESDGYWHKVKRCDPRARALADRHYSRQTIGAAEFMASGRTLVLVTDDGKAVWGAIENMDPAGGRQWRVSIFRNEGPVLSSELIVEATNRTHSYWRTKYGSQPEVPLTTEVDAKKTRIKKDPGYCFLRAGWRPIGKTTRGLIRLEAP